MEDRLTRIEAIVEANSKLIAENSKGIAEVKRTAEQLAVAAQAALAMSQNFREDLKETDQLTRRNAAAISRLEERMDQYIAEGKEHREFIAVQVEGIKVETRRILAHLFGQSDS